MPNKRVVNDIYKKMDFNDSNNKISKGNSSKTIRLIFKVILKLDSCKTYYVEYKTKI